MVELWDAEAARNNVLPISDGMVDRFAGFIPPAWPAGQSRIFVPGGGPVADESVPLLWGGFAMTADVEVGEDPADGVVFAIGDWFGGYALYAVTGAVHFTFARSADVLELVAPGWLGTGRHDITITYELGQGGAPGRMTLFIDSEQLDTTEVEGMLPMALQHGGAGLRIGVDTGFPVSDRYRPPAPFSGTVHAVRVDTPGGRRPDPADEVRAALHAD